jgi:hypothetical protein
MFDLLKHLLKRTKWRQHGDLFLRSLTPPLLMVLTAAMTTIPIKKGELAIFLRFALP